MVDDHVCIGYNIATVQSVLTVLIVCTGYVFCRTLVMGVSLVIISANITEMKLVKIIVSAMFEFQCFIAVNICFFSKKLTNF